jgi:3-dehydroquinate synthase
VVVSNQTVSSIYGARLARTLSGRYPVVHQIALRDGEQFKTWDSLNQIHDVMLRHMCDRNTIVFALGGGVVGDLAGFAAATYMRGIRLVQVPTTLLAQVDSSVGGKTAINHPLGKNMIGAFHQPILVLCDTSTLATLPTRELSAGLAEIIKYGPIADSSFLNWVELHVEKLLTRDIEALDSAIRRSCEIKAQVVAGDEREVGRRAILNFGHTFGHAIEAGLGFGTWLHGEAVGCGMVMAARLSQHLGLIDESYVERLRRLIECAGLPTVAPKLGVQRFIELMQGDKKADGGAMKFVVIHRSGEASVQAVAPDLVAEVLRACCV